MTKGVFVVKWEALSIIRPLSTIAYFTKLNFYNLEDNEAQLTSNTCCKYLTPPWINFVDFELAPEAKSSFSIIKVLSPLVEASRRTPVPLHPPPIITTSYWELFWTYLRWCYLVLKTGILTGDYICWFWQL